VKGFTAGFPGADAPGTFLALGSDPVLDYLTDLGITAIELLPSTPSSTTGSSSRRA
jgi:isoamylase